MASFFRKFSSLKVTAAILVAFLILTFWGVMAQANAEAAGWTAADAVERFFDSYFVWALGVIPLPAFKSVAVVASLQLLASMVFRLPRGWKNVGLWLMHVALLVLLAGGVAGSELKREYNGFGVVAAGSAALESSSGENLKFFAADDSLGLRPVEIRDAWPYYVHFRGDVAMTEEKNVAMYKAYFDPLHFVPYVFMFLFLAGAAFHYVVKVRGARKSAAQASATRVALKIVPVLAYVACLVTMVPANSQASARPVPIWEGLKADSPVLVDSAVRPFDSFARGFLDDVNGRVTYKCGAGVPYCEKQDVRKISAGNVVRLILNTPEEAKDLAIFKVLRSDVAQALHLPEDRRYVSYAELEPVRGQLQVYAIRDDEHPETLEMRRLYSNVLQYEAVASRTAFSVVIDNAKAGVQPARLSAEVAYHGANLALWAFVFALGASLLALLNLVFKKPKLDIAANITCIATAGILAILFALRTYIASWIPLASLYEIVLLVALLLMAFESGAFVFCKKRTYALMVPVTFLAALLLFFAKFVLEPGDTFRPIPAVLNSSVFLTVHVFTIALGFAGMILSGVVAHLALWRSFSKKDSADSPLESLLYGTLVFGTVFTALGTLLGGVWADFAWGRFWGFDPKECGALFVILWGMLLLHLRAGRLVSERGFALLNCFNVIVTFLCWFGVNLLGVGLHSYGFQGGTAAWLLGFVLADALAIALLASRKAA